MFLVVILIPDIGNILISEVLGAEAVKCFGWDLQQQDKQPQAMPTLQGAAGTAQLGQVQADTGRSAGLMVCCSDVLAV